jgi:hypothetical protein
MIQAKTVIPDQYWILRDQDRKIGNIEADTGGYVVSVNGNKVRFHNLASLREQMPVEFDTKETVVVSDDLMSVHGFPTTGPVYNAIFDVRHQIPLWTEDPRSRSWRAAGWYRVRQHRNWRVMQCPKLIILDRYQYQGPFQTREEAMPS